MPHFKYLAVNAVGEAAEGVIVAENVSGAITVLRDDSLHVISIRERNYQMGLAEAARDLFRQRSPRVMDKVNFFYQLAMMLKGGHTLSEGLVMCAERAAQKPLQEAIVDMLVQIQQGGAGFSTALGTQGRMFPAYIPKMLAVGEKSGQLPAALERVASHMEHESMLRSQYVNSMIYPAAVILVGICVFIGLSIYVVPEISGLVAGSDVMELPFVGRTWLALSHWMTRYGIYGVLALGAVIGALVLSYRKASVKKAIDSLLIRMPFIGTSIRNAAMAQMGWTMHVLMQSGQSVVASLEFLEGNIGNHTIARSLGKARQAVMEGRSLGAGLRQPHIPAIVRDMCLVGERSGELEKAVQGLGEYFQRKTAHRAKRVMALMEPALILVVGGLVAFIYVSFFQTIFTINSSLQ